MSIIRWIHISDIHVKSSIEYLEKYNREVLLESLWLDIKKRSEIDVNLNNLDFAFITGDLAFSGDDSGANDEFQEVVSTIIEPLTSVTDITTDRIFIVPGNHDISRSAIDQEAIEIEENLGSKKRIIELFVDPENSDKRRSLFRRLENYKNFIESNLPHIDLNTENCSFSQKVKAHFSDYELRIVGLNSSWLSHGGQQDKNKLALGEPVVREMLQKNFDNDLTVALVHHPFLRADAWYNPEEITCLKYVESLTDFLLCGHVHEPAVHSENSFKGPLITLVGGSIFENREWKSNTYNYVVFDTDSKTGTVHLRRYNEGERGPEWLRDIYSTGDKYNGTMPIALINGESNIDLKKEIPQIDKSKLNNNTVEFLHKQNELLNKRPLLSESYPDRDTMEILFPDIYIDPLVIPRRHPLQDPIPLSQWVAENYSEQKRILLIGAAGSGKTTSLIKLQRDISNGYLNGEHQTLPIFYEARSYDWKRKLGIDEVLNYSFQNLQVEEPDCDLVSNSYANSLVFIDAIDEAFPIVYQEYGSLDYKEVLIKFPHVASCRIDFFERNLSDAAFCSNYDEILELVPWKIDREVNSFLLNYFDKQGSPEKFSVTEKIKEFLKQSSGEKDLPLTPLTVTAFLFIWNYNRDEVENKGVKSFATLLRLFIMLWARREVSGERTCFNDASKLFLAYETVAWVIYKKRTKSRLTLDDLCSELSKKVGIKKVKLLDDRGLLSIIRLRKAIADESIIVMTFSHEAIYEFLLAHKMKNVLAKTDPDIDIFNNLLGFTINRFAREIIDDLSASEKGKLIKTLKDDYYKLLQSEQKFSLKKIIGFFLKRKISDDEKLRKSERIIRRHNLTYFWGRVETGLGGNQIQLLYHDLSNDKISDHVMVVNTIGSSLLFTDNYELIEHFLENLLKGTSNDICNRTYHRVYYGDASYENPDTFLIDDFKNNYDDWPKTRKAILNRLNQFHKRAQCLRSLDLVTFRRLVETRGLPSLNSQETESIKKCTDGLNLIGDRIIENTIKHHRKLLQVLKI